MHTATAAPLNALFRLLASALLLVATEGVMQLDQCELCEIALNEGHHFMVRMMEANKGKQIRLEKEFDALRTDYSTWSQYNPFYKSAMDMFYLSEDKKDTHFRSIMWKFHSVYGAKDFSKEDLAKGHHFGGAVDAANVYGMWKKECVDISGFCKKSDLRVPAFKLNQCGICRNVVREITIGLRRRSETPGQVPISAVENVVESACESLLMWYEGKQAKKMFELCDELMDEFDNSLVKVVFKAMHATGEVDWPNTEPGFTSIIEEAVCLDHSEACSSKKQFDAAVDGQAAEKKKKAASPYGKKKKEL
jgi:hypothetical protein